MKISIIMVCYNSQHTIGWAIKSFLEQDLPEKELIVVDGGSKDRTCNIIESFYSDLIRLESAPDNGIYDAMNKGLRRVTGDAFGFLNSDDCYARADALSLFAKALDHSDVVSGGLSFVYEHDGSAPVRLWHPSQHTLGSYKRGFSLPHPTTYARYRVLQRVGEFDVQYRSAGDYDWLMRALEIHGFSHSIIDEVLVNMRLGGESTSGLRAVINNSREMLAVRRANLDSGFIDSAVFLNLVGKLRQLAWRRTGV